MIDLDVAEKLKAIIKERGGYDKVSEITGINRQTLIRICTGKTDPKFSNVVDIISLSSITLDELVHGKEIATTLDGLIKYERERQDSRDQHEFLMMFKNKLMNRIYSVEGEVRQLQEMLHVQSKELNELKKSK
jgi:DNA-binding XRE family transcriptional regulator